VVLVVNEDVGVGRLRQEGHGHMEIAWQHVGEASVSGEQELAMLSRREECWMPGSGRAGGGGERREECLGGCRGGRRRRTAWT
jgi:hypothetical protein